MSVYEQILRPSIEFRGMVPERLLEGAVYYTIMELEKTKKGEITASLLLSHLNSGKLKESLGLSEGYISKIASTDLYSTCDDLANKNLIEIFSGDKFHKTAKYRIKNKLDPIFPPEELKKFKESLNKNLLAKT